MELCIFSEHLEHGAWDLCRTLMGCGGLEVGNFLSWSTTFNPCHKKEQLKCPGGLPGAALPESLCQASHSITPFSHAWHPVLACFKIGRDLVILCISEIVLHELGPKDLTCHLLGWSFDFKTRTHFRSLTWFCVPAYPASQVKKESIKGIFFSSLTSTT